MKRQATLSVLMVSERVLVRLGLRQILSHEFRGILIGEALSAEAALTKLEQREWQLIVLDISDHNAPEFKLLRELRIRAPQTKVIVLAQLPESVYGPRALQLGASGYVSQTASRTAIFQAVKSVISGKEYFHPATRLAFDRIKTTKHNDPKLSIQEYRVLMALTAGRRQAEIAADLNISGKTVSTYKSRILNKLGLGSVADLVRYVTENRLA